MTQGENTPIVIQAKRQQFIVGLRVASLSRRYLELRYEMGPRSMYPNLPKAVRFLLAVLEGGAVEPHSWERQIDVKETSRNCLCTISVGFETPQFYVS